MSEIVVDVNTPPEDRDSSERRDGHIHDVSGRMNEAFDRVADAFIPGVMVLATLTLFGCFGVISLFAFKAMVYTCIALYEAPMGTLAPYALFIGVLSGMYFILERREINSGSV